MMADTAAPTLETAAPPQFDVSQGMPEFDAIPRGGSQFDLSKGMPSFDQITPSYDESAAIRERQMRGHVDAPTPQTGDYWDHFYTTTAVGRVLGAIGQGFEQNWGADSFVQSPEIVKQMRDAGFYNDYANGQKSLVKSFNESLIRSYLAPVVDLFLKTGSAGLGAYQAGLSQVGTELEGTALDRTLGAASAARDLAGLPEAFFGGGIPELPNPNHELRRIIADAQAIDHSEAAYFGQEPRTPPTVILPDEAQMEPPATHPGPGPAVWDGATGDIKAAGEPAAAPDVHAVAREIAPEVMSQYDALSTRRDTYRQWLTDLAEQRQAETPESPEAKALQEQEASILGKVGGVESKLTKAAARRLADVRDQIDGLTAGDSPDMAKVRQALVKADQGMRDLAPDVSAAYARARELVPEEAEESAPGPAEEISQNPQRANALEPESASEEIGPAPADSAAPEQAAQTEIPAQTEIGKPEPEIGQQPEAAQPTTLEHVAAIADDVTQKLVAAGRPQEEATAAAQVIAAHYEARAARLGKNALDLYQAEGPEIRAGAAGGRKGGAAGKTVFKDAQTVVTLFGKADASTFMHETGHIWLEEMMRDAADEAAPADLKADAKTVRDWLGAEDEIKTKQHEKFARAFERYLYEGSAPTPGLAGVFQQFRSWLVDIYGKLKGVGQPISDDIRDVFDRLIAKNPERQERPAEAPKDHLSAIHEADAEVAPPQLAKQAGDLVEQEAGQAEQQAGLQGESNGRPPGGPGQGTGGVGEAGEPAREPEPVGATAGGAAESHPVETGAGETPTKSPGARAKPSDTPAGPNQPFTGPDSDLVDKAGNIRLDNLNSTESVNDVLRSFAEQNGMFMDARRGIVSSGEILDFADAMGVSASEINIQKLRDMSVEDGVPLASRIVRGRQMLIDSARAVHDAMMGNDELAYEIARDRHLRIQETLSGITAEWGRAGQAFRLMKGEAGEASELAGYLAANTGRTLYQIQQEMKFGKRLRTAQQVSSFVHNTAVGKLKNAIIFYYVNALISGPITHARYAVGNAVNALWTPLVHTPIAAAYGAISGNPDRVYFSEILPQLMAIGPGSVDGWRAGVEAFLANQSPLLPTERGGGVPMADHVQPIPGPIGTAIGVPGRSVAAIHSFFKSLRYEQNIQALAVRTALKEGLEGEEMHARIAELTMRPTEIMIQDAGETRLAKTVTDENGIVTHEPLDAAHQANVEAATRDTLKQLYMEPTDYHSLGGMLTRAANSNLIAKLTVPFMKIGMQIEKRAIEESLAAPILKGVREDIAKGGAARDMALAKMTAGTALMGITAYGVLSNVITGDGPSDPDQRHRWLMTHRPNTITIGDITIPFQGLGQLGVNMRFAANMTENIRAMDDEEAHKVAVGFLEGVVHAVLDENFMRNVKDMLDAVFHPQEYGAQYVKSFALNWLPYSVGLGQVARVVDPYMREANDILEGARAKTPWESETLKPRRDFFGEPILNYGGTDRYANDPVMREMDSLHIGIGKLDKAIRGVKLTEDQYDDFARIAGRYTKMHLDMLVKNPGWTSLPQATRIEVIHKTIAASREAARGSVMGQYPQIARDAARALAVKKGASLPQ